MPLKLLQSLLSLTVRSECPRWEKLNVDCLGSRLVTFGPGTASSNPRIVGFESGLVGGGSGAGVEPVEPLPPPHAVRKKTKINVKTVRLMRK